jgi:2-dehydropantoate 2-reductase
VLTVQNGIESAERIGAVIGDGHLLAGAAYFPANITAPGEVTYLGKIEGKPHLLLGEPGAGESPRALALAGAFSDAGIVTEVCADTQVMLWEKFCLMAGGSAAMALTRRNIGTVRSDPHMRWLLTQAIAETGAVGRARSVALSPGVEARTLAALDGNPAAAKASLLVDLERGRRLELEGLSGAVVRLGEALGVDTPVHRTVYAGLKPFVNGAQ